MPPKARFTREKIEEAAYQLAKEKGIDAVAAREVAKAMDMTVTPIFTYFSGMDELKMTVRDRVREEFKAYLRGCLDYYPAFKEFGMRWMRYAVENPNFYNLLVSSSEEIHSVDDMLGLFQGIVDPLVQEIGDTFAISRKDAREMLRHMLVYASGLSGFLLQKGCNMTTEELARSSSEMCLALAVRAKILDGSASIGMARDMLASSGIVPGRKRHLRPAEGQKQDIE